MDGIHVFGGPIIFGMNRAEFYMPVLIRGITDYSLHTIRRICVLLERF